MRIAVVAQQASAGGGTRFLRPLLRALAEGYPDLHLTLLVNSYAAEQFGAALGYPNEIDIVLIDPILCALPVLRPTSAREKFRNLTDRVRRRDHASLLRRASTGLAELTAGFDLVYLSWPYFLEPFALEAPTVATFHDFNYKHDFGSLSPSLVSELERQVRHWIEHSDVAVTSSAFIGAELAQHYGNVIHDTQVIRLSTLESGRPGAEQVLQAIASHGLPEDYVVCPSNTSPHKNLASLIRAYRKVRGSGGPPLVFIGSGTDVIARTEAQGPTHADLQYLVDALDDSGLVSGKDVFALGYVSDQDADALISGARLLVAPSLYEAGSGPALDAWALGTPVAMSAIPPFEEHLSFLGVEAELFDPRQPDDIARTILAALGDRDRALAMARRSQSAIAGYSWSDVAAGYREAFDSAILTHIRR